MSSPEQRDDDVPLFDDAGPYVDRFGLLLLITFLTIVALSLFDLVPTGGSGVRQALAWTVAALLVGATLLLATRASGVAPRRQRAVDVVVIVTVGVGIGLVFAGDTGTAGWWVRVPLAVLSLLVPVVVVRRLAQHRRIARSTVIGSIAAYLLIPVAYFHVFMAVDAVGSTPFFGSAQSSTSFMYFSLVVVTTTGFGDLVAVTPAGRLLTMSEAVVGQIYLVTFVAMIVGLAAQSWLEKRGLPASPTPMLGEDQPLRGDEV
jgi:hypothetical protein